MSDRFDRFSEWEVWRLTVEKPSSECVGFWNRLWVPFVESYLKPIVSPRGKTPEEVKS